MLAIIGGSGLHQIDCFEYVGEEAIPTPFSKHEVIVSLYHQADRKLAFLPRHGKGHIVPPHKINYRANLWALKQLHTTRILAFNAVGGIHEDLSPGAIAVPEQIIDYTSGRDTTFFDEGDQGVQHIDFTNPYDQHLREQILACCNESYQSVTNYPWVMDGGVYACTNGPRLESAAEVKRLQRDGCDMIGMTGMPEAALARELEIPYASLALSVNWAAGIGSKPINMEDINRVLEQGIGFVKNVAKQLLQQQID